MPRQVTLRRVARNDTQQHMLGHVGDNRKTAGWDKAELTKFWYASESLSLTSSTVSGELSRRDYHVTAVDSFSRQVGFVSGLMCFPLLSRCRQDALTLLRHVTCVNI